MLTVQVTINCVSDNFKSTNTGYNSFTVITGWYNHSLKYNSYETIHQKILT